jgi:hypothetical protein
VNRRKPLTSFSVPFGAESDDRFFFNNQLSVLPDFVSPGIVVPAGAITMWYLVISPTEAEKLHG